MARSYADIVKDADAISDKISTQVRTLGLGLLAFTWGALASQVQIARDLAAARKWQLLLISLIAILGLFTDLLQYVFAYQLTLTTIRKMDEERKSEGRYRSIPLQAQVFVLLCQAVGHRTRHIMASRHSPDVYSQAGLMKRSCS
jgi:hypothetical protein